MVRLRAATPAAAMFAAMLAVMLAAAPVEAKYCYSSDVLPAGATFSSPALVVDLEGCTTLELYNSTIGDSGAAAIAQALKSNTALTYLDLSYNNIGDSGAAAIAEALKNNAALTELYLYNNTIGDIGAVAIAGALKSNIALTTLRMNNNTIGDSGAAAIAEALKNNAALTELYLYSNNIGDSGAAALVEALKVNTAVRTLRLGNNNLTCSNHGTQRTGTIDIAEGDRICKCSGLWSSDFCDTDVPGKTALAVVFSVAALAVFVVFVANPKCIRPYRARKQTGRAFDDDDELRGSSDDEDALVGTEA